MDGKFYDLNLKIQAARVNSGALIKTPEGDVTTRSGDWLCETPNGEHFVLRNKVFDLIAVEM